MHRMEYCSSIKMNSFESVLMRWMNIEPIIRIEMSQKEKDKYCILAYIYGIQNNGTEEFIYRATMEKQTQRINLWTPGEGEIYGKSNMGTYITICEIDSQREFAVWLRKLKQGCCIKLDGWVQEGDGREIQKAAAICILMAA